MNIRLAILFFMGMQVFSLSAQTPVAETKLQVPFEGMVGYRITYTGVGKEIAAMYPDSMTLWVKHPVLRAAWHGGLSDTMNLQLHWDASQHLLCMIDTDSNTVWTLDDLDAPGIKTSLKPVGKTTIAGFICSTSELTAGTTKTQYAFSDSLYFPYVLADSLLDSLGFRVPPFMMKGKQSIPLSIKRNLPEGSVSTVAVRLDRTPPPSEKFKLPDGYQTKPFDPWARFHRLVPPPKKDF